MLVGPVEYIRMLGPHSKYINGRVLKWDDICRETRKLAPDVSVKDEVPQVPIF